MIIKEIHSKSILSKSKIYDYVINPYIGCEHSCSYCYARYIKKFTRHTEPWGSFVDVKVNAPELLRAEILKKKKAGVWISGLCDPYQPLEAKYRITRQCLEILAFYEWPVSIQTRSSFVLRDLDILKNVPGFQVCMSITTADDTIRKIFEPGAPSIPERLAVLDELKQFGIRTGAMIAPALPGAEGLVNEMKGKVDYILVDRMNYHHADWVYRKYGMEDKMSDNFFRSVSHEIKNACVREGIDCRVVF